MSTIPTNKIYSNELDVDFVINNTKFIIFPISDLEKKRNSKTIQNTIINVCCNNENKVFFGSNSSIKIYYLLLKFFNKHKPNKIVGIWKQKSIIKPRKVVKKNVINENEIISSSLVTEYVTKEYNPYDAPIKKSLVIIDEKLKAPIPKHPMEYNIISLIFNRMIFTKLLKKKYFNSSINHGN